MTSETISKSGDIVDSKEVTPREEDEEVFDENNSIQLVENKDDHISDSEHLDKESYESPLRYRHAVSIYLEIWHIIINPNKHCIL